jgi:hypothetical protein
MKTENPMSEPQDIAVEAIDFLGKPIQAGCTICYPVRRGSSMWLNKLSVEAVRSTPRGTCVSGVNGTGRRINIYNLTNCVVVEAK